MTLIISLFLCVTLSLLRDPLWLNELDFTTKLHKGYH